MEEQYIAQLGNVPIPRNIKQNKASQRELDSMNLTIDDTVIQIEDEMKIFAFFEDKSTARESTKKSGYHKPIELWIYTPSSEGLYHIEHREDVYKYLDVNIT